MSVLIWVQTVCKGYQQTTIVTIKKSFSTEKLQYLPCFTMKTLIAVLIGRASPRCFQRVPQYMFLLRNKQNSSIGFLFICGSLITDCALSGVLSV